MEPGGVGGAEGEQSEKGFRPFRLAFWFWLVGMVSVFAWLVASMAVVTNAVEHPTELFVHFLSTRRGLLYGSTAAVLTARLALEVALIFYPLFFLILIRTGFDLSRFMIVPLDYIGTVCNQKMNGTDGRRLLLILLSYVSVFAPYRFFRLLLLYASIEAVPASAGVAWSMDEGDPVKMIPQWADTLETALAAIHYSGIVVFIVLGLYWGATQGILRGWRLR